MSYSEIANEQFKHLSKGKKVIAGALKKTGYL